jgi:hypothetical protein
MAGKLVGAAHLIHDNGARPFQVIIQARTATFAVYGCTYNDISNGCHYDEVVISPTAYMRAWVGADPAEKRFYGNSVLMQLSDKLYMQIGYKIETFEPGERILKFASPVGPSNVPYPYAIGERHNFLILEHVVIPNELLVNGQDPYQFYYRNTSPSYGSPSTKVARAYKAKVIVDRRRKFQNARMSVIRLKLRSRAGP